MLRKLKWIMFTITFLAALAIGLGLVFIKTFDPNQYKSVIQTQLKRALGRDIILDGKLEWALFPELQIRINGMQLRNNDQFKFKRYFYAKKIGISAELLPLLKHRFIIKSIRVDDAKITLHTTKKGLQNWRVTKSITRSVSADSATTQHNNNTASKEIQISKITIHNAAIVYHNDQSSTHFSLSGVSYMGRFHQKVPTSEQNAPYGALRHLMLSGDLTIDKLGINKISLANIKASLAAQNGVFTLDADIKNFYHGQSHDALKIDVTANKPTLHLVREIQKVEINGLFDDLGYTNRVKGILRGKLTLSARDMTQIPDTLMGHGEINVDDGNLQGVNLTHVLQTASAFFNRKPLPALQGDKVTPFKSMSGNIVIKNGIVTTENLQIQSPALRVHGKGIVDLKAKQLDYHLLASTTDTEENKRLTKAQAFLGGGFPLRAKGSLSHYKVTPDFERLAKSAAKYFIKKELGNKLEDIGKKLLKDSNISVDELIKNDKKQDTGKKIDRLLKDIFN